MKSISICIGELKYKATRVISRIIEDSRYGDFSMIFSSQHKTRTECTLTQEINKVVDEFRTRLNEKKERNQY